MPTRAKLRADAQLTRDRILAAAEQVFQDQGIDAPVEQVIRTANVARMTFFRHFKNRDSLLAALLESAMDDLQELAEELQGEPDALARILLFIADHMSESAGLVDYWIATDPDHPTVTAAKLRLEQIFDGPIRAAKAAGLCRKDLTGGDIELFVRMLAGAACGIDGTRRAEMIQRSVCMLTEGLMRPRAQDP